MSATDDTAQIARTVHLCGAAGALALTTAMLREVWILVRHGGESTVADEVTQLGLACEALRERIYALAMAHEGRRPEGCA